jgi:hypothetical protein
MSMLQAMHRHPAEELATSHASHRNASHRWRAANKMKPSAAEPATAACCRYQTDNQQGTDNSVAQPVHFAKHAAAAALQPANSQVTCAQAGSQHALT